MFLHLSRSQLDRILRHATAAVPHEACGLIAGRDGYAQEIIAMDNAAQGPQGRYSMEGQALYEALRHIESQGLELLAVYHSHPVGDSLPSRTDITEWGYPGALMLIVGLKHHNPQLQAWRILPDRVQPAGLFIDQRPPQAGPALSRAQTAAIIVALILAFLVLIAVSLSLLPPPPPIPTPGP